MNKILNTIQRLNAFAGTNDDNPTEPIRADFDLITMVLAQDNIPTIKANSRYSLSVRTSSYKVNSPYGLGLTDSSYYAFVPTILKFVIKNIPGFITVSNYPYDIKKHPKEIGTIGNFRLIERDTDKTFLDTESLQGFPTYGIEFTNNLRTKGHIVLCCTNIRSDA